VIVQMIAGVRQQLVCVTGVIHVDLYIYGFPLVFSISADKEKFRSNQLEHCCYWILNMNTRNH
jgi:hypothetical protein